MDFMGFCYWRGTNECHAPFCPWNMEEAECLAHLVLVTREYFLWTAELYHFHWDYLFISMVVEKAL